MLVHVATTTPSLPRLLASCIPTSHNPLLLWPPCLLNPPKAIFHCFKSSSILFFCCFFYLFFPPLPYPLLVFSSMLCLFCLHSRQSKFLPLLFCLGNTTDSDFVLFSSFQRATARGTTPAPPYACSRPDLFRLDCQTCLRLLLFPMPYPPLDLLPCFNSVIFSLGLLPSSSPLTHLTVHLFYPSLHLSISPLLSLTPSTPCSLLSSHTRTSLSFTAHGFFFISLNHFESPFLLWHHPAPHLPPRPSLHVCAALHLPPRPSLHVCAALQLSCDVMAMEEMKTLSPLSSATINNPLSCSV